MTLATTDAHWRVSVATLHHADARRLPVADGSVHCVVTSPPYWGLRDYGHEGQIGLEATPEEYVAALVDVFREVRRVLRPDGVVWLNLGDSYANDGKWGGATGGNHSTALHGPSGVGRGKRTTGLKPKDLAGIPWRVAFALQDDGWWLRSEVIWSKPNPMPESVTDRPTKAHEHVFLLARSAEYFYDQDAIREPMTDVRATKNGASAFRGQATLAPRGADDLDDASRYYPENGRNARDVWEIATRPYSGAHFAVMPEALAVRCILAGTSAHGCCAACGAPWARDVERARTIDGVVSGWAPSCSCGAGVVPCTVLDPFCGSGTVPAMAVRHGRRGVGIDGNAAYLDLARERVLTELERSGQVTADNAAPGQQLGLFA